jgi:CDP-glucose 4,6-dehydratase
MHGAKVFGYALPAEGESALFNSLQLANSIDHAIGDIRDVQQLAKTFERVQPDVVFHLAAQALVRRSYKDPVDTFSTNVTGSLNILECVRQSSTVKALVFVTSDKCYLNQERQTGYSEDDKLGGHDPYSASKAAAELTFATYNDSYYASKDGFGAASVRAGNVIGGGDWSEDRIIPDCIRALRNSTAIVLRKPEATRPWQHVLEPLSGYVTVGAALLTRPASAIGSWNFGPPENSVHTVHEVAMKCVEHWGSGSIEIQSNPNDPHEASLLQLNCTKAQNQLSWKPRWNFERTLLETVSWYRAMSEGTDVLSTTMQQIKQYEESDQ